MIHPTLADLQNEATWLERRALIPPPLFATEMVTTEQSRAEFLEGARLLRLDQLRNYQGETIGPTPIQLAVADTLAAGRKMNGINEPRRTGKTSGTQAVLMGRCSLREDYLVGWTLATTGAKAGERFKKDIAAPLARLYPDPKDRPFKIELSKGAEGLVWPSSGSYFNVYSPNGDGFRSNAFDTAWIDEGGEAEVELGEDLTAAIRPTLHTRADAQLIISGTAAKYRAGNLLWDALNDPRAAVLRHGVRDDIDLDELEEWTPTADFPRARVRELVIASHPGIGWTTPLEAIEDDFKTPAMRRGFNAEILGIFGSEGSNVALIPAPLWTAAALPLQDAAKPDVSTLCLFVHPDGDWASLVQAWKGKDHRTHVGLLHHQAGVKGLGKKVLVHARNIGRPIIFDSASAATANLMRELAEARPAPAQRPMVANDVKRAAVKFTTMIREDGIRHYGQLEMDAAAGIAVRRAFGTGNGWAFGRPDPRKRPGDDITPIEAAALAVYALDAERAYRSPLGDMAGV